MICPLYKKQEKNENFYAMQVFNKIIFLILLRNSEIIIIFKTHFYQIFRFKFSLYDLLMQSSL